MRLIVITLNTHTRAVDEDFLHRGQKLAHATDKETVTRWWF